MKAEHANGTPTCSALFGHHQLETDLNISYRRFPPRSRVLHHHTPETHPKVRQEVAHLLQGKDDKGSSAAGVDDDGNEFGVDGAEGAVPRDPGDADVIVALVVSHRLAENVTELALSHNSPHHICGHMERSDDTVRLFH